MQYKQDFNTRPTGALWANNVDSAKLKAKPENAPVTAACGPDGSNCLRIIYRHSDGIHKHPFSSPAFVQESGQWTWAVSDTTHSNTATDVYQRNINISGNTAGTARYNDTAVPKKAYTLFYDIMFENGFDFAKGGKLPGLASAEFDSGCTEDGDAKRLPTNWSIRLMWRPNGRLQLYSYDQSRPSGSCGIYRTLDESAGDAPYEVPGQFNANDGKFRFKPGVWYTLRISVQVNDNNSVVRDSNGNPVSGNGKVSLAVKSRDGAEKRLLIFPNVPLRDECDGPCSGTVPDSPATWANAFFFSTFHGGNELKRLTCQSTTMPSGYSGLTQQRYNELCASQWNPAIFPNLTWNPMRPTAARFDNILVNEGYTEAPF